MAKTAGKGKGAARLCAFIGDLIRLSSGRDAAKLPGGRGEMKIVALGCAVAILTGNSPAAAQAVTTYVCTPKGSGAPSRYRFGKDEFHMLLSSGWTGNLCQGNMCQYIGGKFFTQGGGGALWDFSYDPSTGAYSFSDMSSDEMGTRRPG
jgi:hypothetical protein